MKIAFISAEVAPFSKAGGLGDVSGALPKAFKKLTQDVIIITPLHGVTDRKKYGINQLKNGYWMGYLIDDLKIYFIDSPNRLFSRYKKIYGAHDNERFLFFSKKAIKLLKILNFEPNIIHCNDWHTALIPQLTKKDSFFKNTKTVLTIHNLAYQKSDRGPNFLKRGIIYADLITTVSKKYREEILTPEFGEGLHQLLRKRKNKLFGIPNGIDYEDFNPKSDPNLYKNYDFQTLKSKALNKKHLQKISNLAQSLKTPLIGMVSRFSEQKGFDLVMKAAPKLVELEAQFVILGSGDKKYERFFKELDKKQKNIKVFLKFDTKLASQVYAGSDIFLMPSKFEPGGLGQLIALRYGSIPVVRAIGGLADTIGKDNGFVFKKYDSKEMLGALSRTIKIYQNKKIWTSLIKRGMRENHSWEIPAKKYLELFKICLSRKK